MKLTSATIKQILELFEVNLPDDTKNIVHVKHSNPSPINSLAQFKVKDQEYAVLLDDSAEDRDDYIVDEIRKAIPHATGYLVENPQLPASFGVPFEGKDVYLFRFDDGKRRLDSYLATSRSELSRSSWQKQIKNGYVSVDGNVVTSPRIQVSDDSVITVSLPNAANHDEKSLPIVYIDDDVIVVNKPVGVLTHRKNQLDDEFTVADFFRRYTKHALETDRPGIVHRLDRDTSGIIIGARNDRAYEHLKEQFAARSAKKIYVAVIDGVPSEHELHIDLPIARNSAKPGSYKVGLKW